MIKYDVSFPKGGNSEQFIVDGFYPPEPHGSWTSGGCARMAFYGLPPRSPLQLELVFAPCSAPTGHRPQRMRIYANGLEVLDAPFTGSENLTVDLPVDTVTGNGALKLHLVFPDFVIPSEQNWSVDCRELAFSFWSMRIIERIDSAVAAGAR